MGASQIRERLTRAARRSVEAVVDRFLTWYGLGASSPNELVDEDETTGMQAKARAPCRGAVPSSAPYQAFNQHTLG